MNPKIFVGIAAGIIIVLIATVAFSGQNIIGDISKGIIPSSNNTSPGILPLAVELDTLKVTEIDENFAVIDIKFMISNPNQRSIILQFLTYHVFDDDQRVHAGQIGNRFEGFVESSNFYTVLSGSNLILSDKIILKNTGNLSELWAALSNDEIPLRVTGEIFFNLSSMTAGGENTVTFELEA